MHKMYLRLDLPIILACGSCTKNKDRIQNP